MLEAAIIIGVFAAIAIIYWAKFMKKKPMEVVNQLTKTKLFSEEKSKEEKPNLQSQQVWQERRTIM
jgi:Tfp pilus assembly protein PilE